LQHVAENRGMSKRIKQKIENAPTDLLSDADAARAVSVEPRTIRLWRQRRGLPFLKITGKVCRIRRADLDGWLEQHRVALTS